jgi:hypothetical protein
MPEASNDLKKAEKHRQGKAQLDPNFDELHGCGVQ